MNRMQEDTLGKALREEGQRMGPGYSRLLHERVMQALGECGMEIAPERRRGNWTWKMSVPLGLAAALAIAAGTWAVLHSPNKQDVAPKVASGTDALVMPKIADVIEAPAAPVADADADDSEPLDQARYASLNRDAEKFVSFVADQVPSFTSNTQ